MNIKTTAEVTNQTPESKLYVAEVVKHPNGEIRTYTGKIPMGWIDRMLNDVDTEPDTSVLNQYSKAVEADNPRGVKINIFVSTNRFEAVMLALQYLSDEDGTLSDEASKLWDSTYHNTGYLDGNWVLLGRTYTDDERVGQVIADTLGKGFDRFDGMALQQDIFYRTQGCGVLRCKANLGYWYNTGNDVGSMADELRDTYLF